MSKMQSKAFQISDRTYDECILPLDIMCEAPITDEDYNYFIGGGDDYVSSNENVEAFNYEY